MLLGVYDDRFRIDRSRNRAAGGSGIGLPVARALVDVMGGRIRVESLGCGSTFYFSIPASGRAQPETRPPRHLLRNSRQAS